MEQEKKDELDKAQKEKERLEQNNRDELDRA